MLSGQGYQQTEKVRGRQPGMDNVVDPAMLEWTGGTEPIMSTKDKPVIIIGGGIAGLECAGRLHARGVAVRVMEAAIRIGGRIKTDRVNGYLMDRGFQVLQTAYPEAQRSLDFQRLSLRSFAPGAMIRIRGRFYTLADPLRRPREVADTLMAPIGGLGDRLRLLRLTRRVTRLPLNALFKRPESTAMHYLERDGFSDTMIARFFVPFFGGVCLDPQIRASSRVLQYVLRMFASGEAALPTDGMETIPRQLAERLPPDCLCTGLAVRHVDADHQEPHTGRGDHPGDLRAAVEPVGVLRSEPGDRPELPPRPHPRPFGRSHPIGVVAPYS